MRVTISSGHGLYVRGASGILDEVNEARNVVELVATYLRQLGVTVTVYHDNTSRSQTANINGIVAKHNATKRDLDISVHFNAGCGVNGAGGVEVLYYSASKKALAGKLSKAMAETMGLPNRGAKKRTDLGFLKRTNKPAILIETCFVEATSNAKAYKEHFDALCRTIAEVIAGKTLPKPQPKDDRQFRLVTGVFGSKESAETTAEKIRKANGILIYIKEEGDKFRLVSGIITGKANAEASATKIKNEQHIIVYVKEA